MKHKAAVSPDGCTQYEKRRGEAENLQVKEMSEKSLESIEKDVGYSSMICDEAGSKPKEPNEEDNALEEKKLREVIQDEEECRADDNWSFTLRLQKNSSMICDEAGSKPKEPNEEDNALEEKKLREVIQDEEECRADDNWSFTLRLQKNSSVIFDEAGSMPIDHIAEDIALEEKKGIEAIVDYEECCTDNTWLCPTLSLKPLSGERTGEIIQDEKCHGHLPWGHLTILRKKFKKLFLKFKAGYLLHLLLFAFLGVMRVFSRSPICVGLLILLFLPVTASDEQLQCYDSTNPKWCSKGEYLSNDLTCLSCPTDTFTSHNKHQCRECKKCSTPDIKRYQNVSSPCTDRTNTVIGCLLGYIDHSDKDDDVHTNNDPDCRSTGENQTVDPQPKTSNKDMLQLFSTTEFSTTEFSTTSSTGMTPATNVTIPTEDEGGLNTLHIVIIILVMVLLGFIGLYCWKYGPKAKATITACIRAQGNLENNNNDQRVQFLKVPAVMVRCLTPSTES